MSWISARSSSTMRFVCVRNDRNAHVVPTWVPTSEIVRRGNTRLDEGASESGVGHKDAMRCHHDLRRQDILIEVWL